MTEFTPVPCFSAFEAFLRQARYLQGQGATRLARDHIVAALGAAMSSAREAAEAAYAKGASVSDALQAGIAKLEEIRDSIPPWSTVTKGVDEGDAQATWELWLSFFIGFFRRGKG
jgi:hypothetical protein